MVSPYWFVTSRVPSLDALDSVAVTFYSRQCAPKAKSPDATASPLAFVAA